jgi:hypothetical protein
VGLSLIPAFGTLYQRLTLPEAKRYIASKKDFATSDSILDGEKQKANVTVEKLPVTDKSEAVVYQADIEDNTTHNKAHFRGQLCASDSPTPPLIFTFRVRDVYVRVETLQDSSRYLPRLVPS